MHAKKKRVKKKTLNSASILFVIICECRPKKRIAVTLLYYVRSRLSRVSFVDSTTQQQPDHIRVMKIKIAVASFAINTITFWLAFLERMKDEHGVAAMTVTRLIAGDNCFFATILKWLWLLFRIRFFFLSVFRKLLARFGLKPLWKKGKTAALTKALHLDAMGNALTHTGISYSYSIYIQHTHTWQYCSFI